MKAKKRVIILALAVVLYALTWLGGPASHAKDLQDYAQLLWNRDKAENEEQANFYAQNGMKFSPMPLREGGPVSRVDWCYAVFPGMLVANSSFSLGRNSGQGGVRIVFYYGFGSVWIGPLSGWMS